jgi:hypothetical protein
MTMNGYEKISGRQVLFAAPLAAPRRGTAALRSAGSLVTIHIRG